MDTTEKDMDTRGKIEAKKYIIIASYTFENKEDIYFRFADTEEIASFIDDCVNTHCKYDALKIHIIEISTTLSLDFNKKY
ncbi:MAG: hypothetical protein OHK0036_14880 [Bacteroidia bacterium]